MAQFGKADIGLIKATAGAEAAQFTDDNLMWGAAIGTAMNAFNEQAKLQQSINAGLEKEIDDQFEVVTGNPSQQFTNLIAEITPGYKKNYVSNRGKDVTSKQQKQFYVDDYNGIIQQIEDITGITQTNRDAGDFGPGANADHIYYNNMISAGNYLVETRRDPNKNNGYTQVNVAIPKKTTPDPTTFKDDETGNTVQGILDKQANDKNYVLTENDKKLITRYQSAVNEHNKWKSLPDKIDGYYNTEKFQIYNSKNLPTKGENFENKTKALALYNQNITTKKTDADLLNPKSADSYASDWEKMVREGDTSGVQLQHQVFGDFSDDGVDNPFSNIFINGVNTDKHPDMYKALDGSPLVFNLGAGKSIEYGSAEWNAMLENGEHSPEQKQLLENFLRGYDTDGSVNPDQNKEWIIKKYSAFMGKVNEDAFNAKRKLHFEQKGRYFNDGQGEQDVWRSQEVALTRKKAAYNNTLTDIAFPKNLINLDVGGQDLTTRLDNDGSIAKAFKDVFADYIENGQVDFDFDDGVVTIDGENLARKEFDFTGENKVSELEKLKRHLAQLDPPDQFEIDQLSNDVSGADWAKLRDRQNEYHTYSEITFDPSANLPTDTGGNIITQ